MDDRLKWMPLEEVSKEDLKRIMASKEQKLADGTIKVLVILRPTREKQNAN